MTTPPIHPAFEGDGDSARLRLLASPMGGLLPGEKVANLFCGAGGWEAAMRRLGIRCDFAVNHWPIACDTHRANYPECECHQGDSWKTPPRTVVGDAVLGLLCASAACTTHSPARGAAPISPRVHMLGWCIARWMKDLRPRMVEIENVPAWQGWGPTIVKRHKNGRPVKDAKGRVVRVQDPKRMGQEFRRWWKYCVKLGYRMEMRILDAVDFGSASRRKRLFIKGRLDGQPIVWPEVTHGRVETKDEGEDRGGREQVQGSAVAGWCAGGQAVEAPGGGDGSAPRDPATAGETGAVHAAGDGRGGDRGGRGAFKARGGGARHAEQGSNLIPHRCAADIIDWSDLGTSIFDRKKMLADKTCKRLARGIGRFVLRDPAPFVLRLTQPESGGHVWSVAEPMATQTARYDFALGAPVISKHYGGVVGDRVGRPTGTVTGVDHHSLGMPVLMHNTTGHPGGPVDGSAPTVTTGGQTGLGTPIVMQSSQTGSNGLCSRPANEPAPTQTTCQDLMLGTPVLTPCGGPKREPSRVDEAANTILTREDRGLGLPLMSVYRSQNVGGRVDAPTDGITAGAVHNYIATPLGMQYYGGSQTLHRSDEHLGCVPTVDRHAIATPVMTTVGFGEREGQDARCQAPTAPTNTVVAGGVKQGVVSPVLEVFPAATRERALKTAAFLVEHLGAEAGGGVRLSVEGFAVVVVYGVEYVIVDILFRMLRVRELAAAMGFPADYVWPRTQRDAVKCIGNAVQIDCAEALLASSMPREAEKKRKECAA